MQSYCRQLKYTVMEMKAHYQKERHPHAHKAGLVLVQKAQEMCGRN